MRLSFHRFRMLPLFAACAFAGGAHAGDSPSLEERMSYKEFTAYGLDKLSAEQLQGLNGWLAAHAACNPTAAGTATPPAAGAPSAHGSSRLVGDFSGWEKGAVLTVANGQRWEVRDEEPFVTARETEPLVTIEPGVLGGWRLSVAGHGEVAHVIPAGH